jgi:hypothetical protein
MLEERDVGVEELLLDPNNPRLAASFRSKEMRRVSDQEARGRNLQSELEQRFGVPQTERDEEQVDRLIGDPIDDGGDGFFSVDDLKGSIRQIGFVGIQNLVVRRVEGGTEYIVLEGNRRVAALKSVIAEHKGAISGPARIDDDAVLETLKSIRVMVLQTDGMSPEQIQEEIDRTLGLRHYGAQLPWDILPRAKNIFDEFTKMYPEPMEYRPDRGNKVAQVLAIGRAEVKKLLRGYVVYEQLCDLYPVKDDHFSLILAAIENRSLVAFDYFGIHESSFELQGNAAERIDQVCEFMNRDRNGFEKTINDPKAFKRLGVLLRESKQGKTDSIRDYATGRFDEVVTKEVGLDVAHADLINFKREHQWVQVIQELIERQRTDDKLVASEYIGQGQELELKEELEFLVVRFKTLSELSSRG